MIASMSFRNEPPSWSGTTVYTISATPYYDCNFTIWLPPQREDNRRTSRHIPFYRALFDQRFPSPASVTNPELCRRKWAPNMGRVRIDRRAPTFTSK